MVLFINACIRKENSRTLQLAHAFLQKKYTAFETVDLNAIKIEPLRTETLQIREEFAPKRDFHADLFNLAKQFANAKEIIIAAPFWDDSFPAILKVYIEHIMVCGITFDCANNTLFGLCKAKNLHYITTAGGYIENRNLGYEYLKAIAKMTGISHTHYIEAQALDLDGNNPEQILQKIIQNW